MDCQAKVSKKHGRAWAISRRCHKTATTDRSLRDGTVIQVCRAHELALRVEVA